MADIHSYRIDGQVFARFPGYVRGVILAHGVTNGPSPEDLIAQLRDEESSLRKRLNLETIAEHPRIKPWREAYRAFGAKPSEFRPSVEALARRVLRGDALPAINALVDIGTVISLRHLVPAGAHAIDALVGDLTLGPAVGTETFTALGSEVIEHPYPGEIIFAEGNTVLTRRWTWRQGLATQARAETRAVEFNVDGLPPVTAGEVAVICAELAGLVTRFCGGRTRLEMLTADNCTILISE